MFVYYVHCYTHREYYFILPMDTVETSAIELSWMDNVNEVRSCEL